MKTVDTLRSAQGTVVLPKGSILYGTAHRIAESGNTVSISVKFKQPDHAGSQTPLSIYLVGPVILEGTKIGVGPPSVITFGPRPR